MIPVADRPLLEFVVEAVAEAGIDDVPFGGVTGDHTRVAGTVVLEPGTVVGDCVTVHEGVVLDGHVDSTVTVRRG